MKKFFLILFLFLFTSCANAPVGWGGKYEVVQSNSKSITIKYDTILGAPRIVSYLIVIDLEFDCTTSYLPPHPTGAFAQEVNKNKNNIKKNFFTIQD